MFTHLCFLAFLFLLFKFTLFFGGGILVLLVFRDQIVHVRFSFSEFHFVHTFTSVPMQKGLATEHGGKLLRNTFEQFLDGSAVSNKGDRHLETTRRNITDGGLDVVGDPFNKVRAILVLDVQQLFVNFLHRHASSEEGSDCEITTMTRITSSHHVLGIKHLLGEFRNSQCAVLLGSTASKRCKTRHKEMKTGEGNHVDGNFSQISIELTRESKTGGDTRHGSRNQMIQITIGGGGELQGSEANIIQGLVINAKGFIGVFDQLMDGKSCVVGFNDCIRHLGGRHHRKCTHNTIRILLTDFRNQKCSHTGTSTTSQRVGELETLKAVAAFGLFSDNIQNRVNEFSSLGVMTFGPVVSGTGLSEHKVVWAKELTKGTSTDRVHGSWLKIHKDSSGNILSTSSLVIVDIDTFQLEVRVSVVSTSGVNSVLVGDDFPKLGTDLVTALTCLNVNNLTHDEE
eukprot:Sdes_comp10306_c0_seq1m1941